MSDEVKNEVKPTEHWERDLVNRLAFSALNEQRRTRRWNIFFRGLLFLYLFVLLAMFLSNDFHVSKTRGKHTAVVEVRGEIADGGDASADRINAALRSAFEDENTAGVVLRINSPGGSPVQSAYIYDEIRRLRTLHPQTPIYAVIGDICASGGYYIAAATDAIYANKSSIVGSIGVLMNGFGFVGAMEKFGVERRLYTAGTSKGFLDPFSPAQRGDVEHMRKLLEEVHGQFIAAVKEGRGERLKDDPKVFTGLVWTGDSAQQLGLVDALSDTDTVARDIIGAEDLVDFTVQPDYFERLAQRFGAQMASTFLAKMELTLR